MTKSSLPVSFLFLSALVFTAKHSPEAMANGVFGGNPGIRVEVDAGAGYSVNNATAVLDRAIWRSCATGAFHTQRYNQQMDLSDTLLQAPAGDWCEVQLVFGSLLVLSGQNNVGSTYSVGAASHNLVLPIAEGGFDRENLPVVQRYGGVFGGNPGITASVEYGYEE